MSSMSFETTEKLGFPKLGESNYSSWSGNLAGLVRRLDGVNADGPVKQSCRKEVRIARAPVNLESPVIRRGEL